MSNSIIDLFACVCVLGPSTHIAGKTVAKRQSLVYNDIFISVYVVCRVKKNSFVTKQWHWDIKSGGVERKE